MRTECDNYPVLYKYAKREWAVAMVEQGTFRAGTVSEYRKSEEAEVRDEGEGTRSFNLPDDYLGRPAAVEHIIAHNPHLLGARQELLDFCGNGVPSVIQEWSLDCYAFCLTTEFDPEVMRRFKYDACVEILDPTRFFNALCLKMQPFGTAGVMRPCVYADRWRAHDDQLPIAPELIKPPEFAHQKEVRILWSPRDRQKFVPGVDLSGQTITARSARKFCRMVDVSKACTYLLEARIGQVL